MTSTTGKKMNRGKIEKTEKRWCAVCKRETEQMKDGKKWVCAECLMNPKSDFEEGK